MIILLIYGTRFSGCVPTKNKKSINVKLEKCIKALTVCTEAGAETWRMQDLHEDIDSRKKSNIYNFLIKQETKIINLTKPELRRLTGL